ncbi:MAG: antibiotic biosynthesis monooxygenase [Holophagaceae bacterium]|nr:antibiotic biosynthesis monooxygenase [Holophagaceae bacterium]
MSETIVIVRYRSLPDQADTARRELGALVATVLAREPECGGITLLQDAQDPTGFTLLEHWPSQALFLGPHMQQPHLQAFIQGAGAFLAGPPDISFWHAAGTD